MLFFLICFFASVIGAICGIGGGILIKPLLDAFHVMDVETISFLSGCTVLSMTTFSVIKSKLNRKSNLYPMISFPLAIGAAVGGLLGKWIFSFLLAISSDTNKISTIQAVCLLIITLGCLTFTLYKKIIRTYHITNPFCCITIGTCLGIISSFLGIGGGPMNLLILFFFFSMSTKVAAENSLYIIFFSQLASLIFSIFSDIGIPDFLPTIFILMVVGGITGGIYGQSLNKRLSEHTVNILFIFLMIVIIQINIYNIYRFTR